MEEKLVLVPGLKNIIDFMSDCCCHSQSIFFVFEIIAQTVRDISRALESAESTQLQRLEAMATCVYSIVQHMTGHVRR